MNWVRTIFALWVIGIALFVIRWFTDDKTLVISAVVAGVTFIALALVMDDDHASWLVRTTNIPAWGQWVAGIIALILIAPMLWAAIRSAWEAVFGSLNGTQCLVSGAAVVIAVIFILLNRRRPRRNNQNHPNAP